MQLRPPARLLASAGALVLAASLSSCGFGYATDRNYTPGAAVNDRDATVDVLGALVVSGKEGSGTFIAAFANNDPESSATVESIAGGGDDASLKVVDFQPIDIDAGQLVNLSQDGGVALQGDFKAGDFITLDISFSGGDSVEMDVPVYPPCNEFEGLDGSSSSSSSSSSASPSESPSESASGSASESPSASESLPSPSEAGDPCSVEATFGELGGEVS